MRHWSVHTRLNISKITLTIGVAVAFVAMSLPVQAQQPPERGLSISPLTFELSANPGDTLTNTVRLDNISDEALEINTAVRNFSALGEEGQVTLDSEAGEYSLAAWMSVDPATAVLAPGESRFFNFTINIPPNGEPGGHFGSVVFSTKIEGVSGSGAAVGQEIGALVLLRVTGDTNEKLAIESFNTVRPTGDDGTDTKVSSILPGSPVMFESRVANEGNVYTKPSGIITITDVFNRTVGEVELSGQNVLPGAIRKMGASWESDFMFGKYDAQLTLTYGAGANEKIVTETTTFYVIPYQNTAFLVAVGIAVFLLFALIFWRRRFAKAFGVLFKG